MINLDKTEKRIFLSSVLLMGVFIFFIQYAKSKYKVNVPECLPYDKAYLEPKINKLDEHTYQVFGVAQMWSFLPAEIKIPQGSEVDFYLTSKDVVHGFNIAEKNVNNDGGIRIRGYYSGTDEKEVARCIKDITKLKNEN